MKNRKGFLRIAALGSAAALLLCCVGCGEAEAPAQDSSPLTMYIGLGLNNGNYYEKLHEIVLEETGIELQYVFSRTLDTSTAMVRHMANQDLPADIVVTASYAPEEIQKNALLDLAAYTNLTDLFTTTKIQSISVDGSVYQLPYATRLIGIEYNKTLLEEMGWTLPENFSDMIALKQKADEAGIEFAVSCGAATGHGFNYLMHLMGTQYLISPDGAKWFSSFRAGTAELDEFAAEADYFAAFADAGLFGKVHDQDWDAKTQFSKERALFYFNIVNDAAAYDGFQYDADGRIVGAQYGSDGLPEVIEDAAGDAVFLDGEYVLYDASNAAHTGLPRCTIPGAVILHDEYGIMPWLSENGSSNCFTTYDCMVVSLSRKLAAPEQQDRLKAAAQVLELMTTPRVAELFTQNYPDGYVGTTSFSIDESRLYYDCRETVQKGYLMPWYYNSFDTDSIVNVGQKVNDFLKGLPGTGLDEILAELALRNENYLNGTSDIAATFTETLDYAECAALEAIANGLSLQSALDDAGLHEEVTASVLPYTRSLAALPVGAPTPVVQEKIYSGALLVSELRSVISSGTAAPVGIRMTGAELRALIADGFSVTDSSGSTCSFDYCCVVKDDAPLKDEAEYIVAVAPDTIKEETYQALLAAGNVLTPGGTAVTGSTEQGLSMFFGEINPVSPDMLRWAS